MIVAPVVVHPVPVVALGIDALNSNCVPLNPVAMTVCVPLMAAMSAAVHLFPVLAATPEMVTSSPMLSVLAAVTVTVVVVAVTLVGLEELGLALTCTGKFPPTYAGAPTNVGLIA